MTQRISAPVDPRAQQPSDEDASSPSDTADFGLDLSRDTRRGQRLGESMRGPDLCVRVYE